MGASTKVDLGPTVLPASLCCGRMPARYCSAGGLSASCKGQSASATSRPDITERSDDIVVGEHPSDCRRHQAEGEAMHFLAVHRSIRWHGQSSTLCGIVKGANSFVSVRFRIDRRDLVVRRLDE